MTCLMKMSRSLADESGCSYLGWGEAAPVSWGRRFGEDVVCHVQNQSQAGAGHPMLLQPLGCGVGAGGSRP